MKIKKLLASVAATAMAVSMMSAFSASALSEGATTIDFEDGDFSFVYENTDAGQNAAISVADYNGSKQLSVYMADSTQSPKIWFDLDKILPRESTIKITTIEMDITIVPTDSAVQTGWMGGALATAGGFDMNLPSNGQANPSWTQGDILVEGYEDGVYPTVRVSRKILLPATQGFTEKGINPFFGVMMWARADKASYTMYIDNVTLSDANGKAISLGLPAVAETEAETEAAAEETTAAVEETTAAPAELDDTPVAETEAVVAETEAAPAETTAPAADTTTAPATGNTTAVAIVSVMAIAGAAAIVAKKRK